jgi:hypothetical protein
MFRNIPLDLADFTYKKPKPLINDLANNFSNRPHQYPNAPVTQDSHPDGAYAMDRMNYRSMVEYQFSNIYTDEHVS